MQLGILGTIRGIPQGLCDRAIPSDAAEGGAMASPSQFRYLAFISYSHEKPDGPWTEGLHSWLESYRVPRDLARRP